MAYHAVCSAASIRASRDPAATDETSVGSLPGRTWKFWKTAICSASTWPGTTPSATNSRAVVVADLNGDGRADLAVANSNGTVSVLLGNAGGTFGTAQAFPTDGNSSRSPRATSTGTGRPIW